MANYMATTVSEGGKINDRKAVEEIIAKWGRMGSEGEITAEVDEKDVLHIYGYDHFDIYKVNEEGDEDDDDATEECLKELCPFIETPLIIQSVGAEKCRYVGTGAWIVMKEGVFFTNLDEAINAKMDSVIK